MTERKRQLRYAAVVVLGTVIVLLFVVALMAYAVEGASR